MTSEQLELYTKTIKRLGRVGINDPIAQILALSEEIERYRSKIHGLEAQLESTYNAFMELQRNTTADRIGAAALSPLNKHDEAVLARMEVMPK